MGNTRPITAPSLESRPSTTLGFRLLESHRSIGREAYRYSPPHCRIDLFCRAITRHAHRRLHHRPQNASFISEIDGEAFHVAGIQVGVGFDKRLGPCPGLVHRVSQTLGIFRRVMELSAPLVPSRYGYRLFQRSICGMAFVSRHCCCPVRCQVSAPTDGEPMSWGPVPAAV